MSRKSFKSATQEAPIEFDIDGIVFHAKPQMPAGILMKFAELTGGDDSDDAESNMSGSDMIKAVRMFFNAALVKADHQRFFDLLDSEETVVDLELLTDIAGWLAGEYSARPTGENSSPTSSETASGPGSTVGASASPLTFSRPDPVPTA